MQTFLQIYKLLFSGKMDNVRRFHPGMKGVPKGCAKCPHWSEKSLRLKDKRRLKEIKLFNFVANDCRLNGDSGGSSNDNCKSGGQYANAIFHSQILNHCQWQK